MWDTLVLPVSISVLQHLNLVTKGSFLSIIMSIKLSCDCENVKDMATKYRPVCVCFIGANV